MARVLLITTHLQGVGHLTRTAALGRGLARAGHAVTLVSGGAPVPWIDVSGMRLAQLPPARIENNDFRRLLDGKGAPVDEAWRATRAARISEAFEAAQPDVLVTELYPFGRRALAREFDDLLERTPKGTIVAASVRDVLVSPSSPAKAAAVEETIARFYDAVLVHGDPDFLPLDASWPVTPSIAGKLVYTGYVAERAFSAPRDGLGAGEILVSAGGSATGAPLFRAALGAASLWPDGPNWRILTGNRLAPDIRTSLTQQASAHVTIESARDDFPEMLGRCAVSVSRGGYNTIVETLAARARAVIVPFEDGRETEQRQRAEALAQLETAQILLPERDLDPNSLLAAVRTALQRTKPDIAPFSLDGVEKSVEALSALTGMRPRQAL